MKWQILLRGIIPLSVHAEKDWEAPGAPEQQEACPGIRTEGSEDKEIRLLMSNWNIYYDLKHK